MSYNLVIGRTRKKGKETNHLSVTVSKANGDSKECHFRSNDASAIWRERIQLIWACKPDTSGNTVQVKYVGETNEFLLICEVTIKGVQVPDAVTPANESSFIYVYISLGGLGLLIVVIVAMVLIARGIKRRDRLATGQNNTDRSRSPSNPRVPVPLPRDEHLCHLESENNNHYSAVVENRPYDPLANPDVIYEELDYHDGYIIFNRPLPEIPTKDT